jgi:hypothetical protein
MKSLAPSWIAWTMSRCWPRAEQMMTRAAGSISRIFFSAVSPSMPGIVMSIRTTSGRVSW